MVISYVVALFFIGGATRQSTGLFLLITILAILSSVAVSIPKVSSMFLGAIFSFAVALIFIISGVAALGWLLDAGDFIIVLLLLTMLIYAVLPILTGIFAMLGARRLYSLEQEDAPGEQ